MLTIAQIAQRAQVSTATVDRVLNGRKGVNEQTAERVMQVMAETDSVAPTTLKKTKKRVLRIAFVLPEEKSEWVEQIERVIGQVAGAERNEHSELIVVKVPTKDPSRTSEHLAKVIGFDGIALMIPDAPATKHSIAELVARGNFVLCIFSDVPGSARHLFIGADNRAGGRTAAKLICNGAQPKPGRKVLLLSRQGRMSAELERRIGFVQVLEESFPEVEVLVKADLDGDSLNLEEKIQKFVERELKHEQLLGIYCASELLHPLSEITEAGAYAKEVTVVAHDATGKNIQLLRDGDISYLLCQDIHYCITNAVQTLKKLRENMRGSLAIVQPRVEILTTENMH